MDPIAPPIQAVLDLFAEDLAEVRFPDLDATVLGRLAADVTTAAGAVAVAQTALDRAREALQQRQDALLHGAQRAMAYARVFAESNQALASRLDAISLAGRSAEASSAPPRRRGRPPKARSERLALEVEAVEAPVATAAE